MPEPSLKIEEYFAPGGPIAARLGDAFEPRPEQARMALAVEQALEARKLLMVEAGTGVGKSFAYLLPAVKRIVESDFQERVVVATNTIALQEQLLRKDVPLLGQIFTALDDNGQSVPAFTAELVKGRGNYVSIRRLKMASERQDKLFADPTSRRDLHAIEDWAYATTDGTLATLPQLTRPSVWGSVQSDSGNCMGRKCPSFEQCFFQRARRKMERANLLICNHALFFSDLALRKGGVGFLPEYHHVILDEAHGVEDVASEHFGVELSEGRIRFLLSTLYNPHRGKGLLASVGITLSPEADAAVSHAQRKVEEADAASLDFFEQVVRLTGHRPATKRLPSIHTQDAEPPIHDTIGESFKKLALSLKALKEHARTDADKYELNAFIERTQSIADQAEIICNQQYDGYVYWAQTETGERGGRVRASLAAAPVEVGPILHEHLYNQKISVILTSATLTTDGASFKHTQRRLGCEEAETIALGSPFDHAAQAELHADASMPDPRSPDYISELVSRIVRHVRETDGGAFVLFTSFDTMFKSAEMAAPALARLDLPMLVHGRDGSREAILDRFRSDERSVLFGTSSFWQGVDVRGRGLRNVIITRLPFDPPDRPLTQARLELIEARGGNAFMEDSLPRAVIRFKQGFGRLIRSKTDSGRVVVLDPRIVTARYGRLFINALPEGVRVVGAESVD